MLQPGNEQVRCVDARAGPPLRLGVPYCVCWFVLNMGIGPSRTQIRVIREVRRAYDPVHANNLPVSYCDIESPCGHDAFLLESKEETHLIKFFLEKLYRGEVTSPYDD